MIEEELFPIGIESKGVWKSKRLSDLKSVIKRYLDANTKVPMEWLLEYNELISEIKR